MYIKLSPAVFGQKHVQNAKGKERSAENTNCHKIL